MKEMIIGSHVSMSAPNFLMGSLEECLSYNANAMMIYTGAPQNTKRQNIDKLKVNEFKEEMKINNISLNNVIIHAPYIINLGNNSDVEKRQFTINFLKEEIKRVQEIGVKILVLHPGNHLKESREVGLDNIVDGLNEVLNEEDDIYIALETMAGKGTELGVTFNELKYIIDHVVLNDKIKVCLDTCHINDAGYDLSNFDQILDEFDEIIGLDKLVCVHLNDSKNIKGSHKDRHANIGDGEIGYDILKSIANNTRISNIPKILETPYIDGEAPYRREIELLKK